MRMLRGVAAAMAILTAAAAWAGDADLEAVLAEQGVAGTVVIASLDGATVWVANEERAARRMSPASTFKIPNTLIALDAGAVAADEVIPWDGVDRGVAAWNRDHTLATAFPVSCVWFYQVLAERVGMERYRRDLAAMSYGNATPGPDVRTFWLDGDLAISALEQVDFLRRLQRRELPASERAVELLRRIMVVDQGPGWTLRAKTGWAGMFEPGVGWYVGTLERDGDVWLFAANLEVRSREDLPRRAALGRAALQRKGLLAETAAVRPGSPS